MMINKINPRYQVSFEKWVVLNTSPVVIEWVEEDKQVDTFEKNDNKHKRNGLFNKN